MADYSASQSASAQQQGTYTIDQLDALEEASSEVHKEQLLAAAELLSEVFDANTIPSAIMGGLSLVLRGSLRDTNDVDMAVGCSMRQLKQVLSSTQSVLRPAGLVADVMRVFVLIDGQYVMVDLILPGSLGAPSNLNTSFESIQFSTRAGVKHLRVINILGIMRSKLAAYIARTSRKDYEDIEFLVTHYAQQVHNIREQLNFEHCQVFIDAFEQTNPGSINANRVRGVKRILGIA